LRGSEKLEKKLRSSPVRTFLNPTKKFILDSNIAMGAVLSQENEFGGRVIVYFRKGFE
jgi:hypothetical protein